MQHKHIYNFIYFIFYFTCILSHKIVCSKFEVIFLLRVLLNNNNNNNDNNNINNNNNNQKKKTYYK